MNMAVRFWREVELDLGKGRLGFRTVELRKKNKGWIGFFSKLDWSF